MGGYQPGEAATEETPEQLSNESGQMGCWWATLAFFVLFWFSVWPMMHFLLPPNPTLTGEELVARYSGNIVMVKAGIIFAIIAALLIIPWATLMSVQIRRMEGRIPVLAITQFGAGVINSFAFIIPYVFWAGAWYRLDNDPAMVRIINDMAWLEWIMTFQPMSMQFGCLGLAILLYRGPRNVFPRWFGYLSLAEVFLIAPGSLSIFFYQGPFTWNGVIGFWFPVISFCIYIPTMLWQLRAAIKTQKNDYA